MRTPEPAAATSEPDTRQPWRAGLPLLRGSGVVLRELTPDDAPALTALATTEMAWPVTSVVPSSDDESVRLIAWLRRERRAGRGMAYGVLAGGDETILGVVRLRRLDAGFRIADAAVVFTTEAWDSHLPAAGLRMVVDVALHQFGVHRLEVRTMTAREAALVRDLGATHEGRLRESWMVGDRLVDQDLWSWLDREWRASAHGTPRVVVEPTAPEPAEALFREELGDDAHPLWAGTPPAMRRQGVTLREIRPEDAGPLLEIFSPDEIAVCVDPPTTDVETFERYIAWAHEERAIGQAVSFVVLVDEQPGPVGFVQVRQIERRAAVADLGIVLAKEWRGTGLFPLAIRLVLDFTFQTMGVHRLEARTSSTNQAGEGSLRKLGAVREAHLRESFPRGDLFEDDDLWSILGTDWQIARRTL